MKNRPSLLSARCRWIDKLHNHQCHGSSNFRCRLLDVQKKKKKKHTHTQLAARVDFAIWRFLVEEVRIMEFKEICACMHAYAEAAGAGPLSLSSYTLPKKFAPLLDKEAPSSSLSLSVSTKGAEIQNLPLPLFTRELIT